MACHIMAHGRIKTIEHTEATLKSGTRLRWATVTLDDDSYISLDIPMGFELCIEKSDEDAK